MVKKYSASNPRVLVSVLNYNSVENTVATLRCLQVQTYPNYRLQMVDNASTNQCVAEIVEVFKDLDVISLPENIGYTGGNNAALMQGLAEGYDHVIICNEDIEVGERMIEFLVETAEACPDAGIVGGLEVDFDTKELRTLGGLGYSLWRSKLNFVTELPGENRSSCGRIDYAQGALVLFTRRALEKGAMLDPDIFIFYDEVDLGFRLRQLGYNAYVDQRVVIEHKNIGKLFNPRAGYLGQRNRYYIVKKHGDWYHKLFYNLYAPLFELPTKFIVRCLQGHKRFAWASVHGYIDGVAGRMGPGRNAEV